MDRIIFLACGLACALTACVDMMGDPTHELCENLQQCGAMSVGECEVDVEYIRAGAALDECSQYVEDMEIFFACAAESSAWQCDDMSGIEAYVELCMRGDGDWYAWQHVSRCVPPQSPSARCVPPPRCER